jgi:endonuclease/exonuclease/phosphatase family metal-dependent hydrolase
MRFNCAKAFRLLGSAIVLLLWPALGQAANLRVVSFNAGMGKVIEHRSSDTLRRTFTADPHLRRAHVLALQELCLQQSSSLTPFIRLMQEYHGRQFHYSDYARKQPEDACGKGQAIVSAYPIVAGGTIHLPRVGARRSALWVDLRVDGPDYSQLRLYNLHLSNRVGLDFTPTHGRSRQVQAVLRHMLEYTKENPHNPVIVAGDFNSLGSLYDPPVREQAVRDVSRWLRPSIDHFTPTMLLPYQVDWIFFSGLRLRRSKVVHVLLSDHFPISADFDF